MSEEKSEEGLTLDKKTMDVLGACPKMPFFLNSLSCSKNYPRNINHIPAVIFFAFLDLRKNCYSR
ncbi:MAG: hypothetical protein U9R17_05590, partial [Thermodesulfobacteriota bacterium]|nr:hypothetical protein [Thermodesulfobacteriota bacterium]